MNSIVEYKGLAKNLPEKIKAYKQFTIKKNIKINTGKLPARDLIKISAKSHITSRRIIKTPEGISLEGEIITGLKYLLKGFITVTIYYEESSRKGLLGVVSEDLKFFNDIVLEKSFMTSNNLISSNYIEDIYVELVNKREILVAITAVNIVEGDEDFE